MNQLRGILIMKKYMKGIEVKLSCIFKINFLKINFQMQAIKGRNGYNFSVIFLHISAFVSQNS
jgi:hypothetical protein